jgi:hypothetical protein
MTRNSLDTGSVQPIAFCWYRSESEPSLAIAIERETNRVELTEAQAAVAHGFVVAAIARLTAGEVRPRGEVRKLKLGLAHLLFEVRITLNFHLNAQQLRVYCGMAIPELAIGLVVRFKTLTVPREQIRLLQNRDIAHALQRFTLARSEAFAKCLEN